MFALKQVWNCAPVLIKYLEYKYGKRGLVGRRVCELGAGTGIVLTCDLFMFSEI